MPRLFVLLSLLCACLAPFAVECRIGGMGPFSKRLELSRFVDYWKEEGARSIEDVRGLPAQAWTRNGSDSVSLGYGDDIYWFRVELTNTLKSEAGNFLEIGYPVLDHVEVYREVDGRMQEPCCWATNVPSMIARFTTAISLSRWCCPRNRPQRFIFGWTLPAPCRCP